MITYQSSKPWQRTWVWALLLGGAIGVGAWWWQSRLAPMVEEPVTSTPVPAPAPHKAPVKVDSALLMPPVVEADGRPSDFSPEDWAALREAMSKTANPKAEMARVVRYLRFQKGFEQWQSMQESADVATRRQLATRLLEQVPERLSQGEMTMGEALMLEAALWTELEPNEDIRKQRLEQAQVDLGKVAPTVSVDDQAAETKKQQDYQQQASALAAQFQALSPAEQKQNQAKFEADLERVRRSVYSGK